MQSRIVVVSDDSDFFEYIRPMLRLRKSDELFLYSFDKLPLNLHHIKTSMLIINSEGAQEKTLDLLSLLKGTPSVVFAYNEDNEFKISVYKNGAMAYITPFMPEEELQARLIPPLSVTGLLQLNSRYREILVRNNLIMPNNEVFIDYEYVLDKELEKINSSGLRAVLGAVSPNEKTKFLIQQNQIETLIWGNIRKNDILMNFAPNKYFILMYDINVETAQKLWEQIRSKFGEKIYAGFVNVTSKTRQQLINEALNRLHEAINYDKGASPIPAGSGTDNGRGNFKIFRQEFKKKIDNTVTPVFYRVQQKYNDKLFGMTIEQNFGDGYGDLIIKGRHCSATFKITTPGFSKINIDITYQAKEVEAKRITLEPEELEAGLLEDLIEQFIIEFKEEVNDDNS